MQTPDKNPALAAGLTVLASAFVAGTMLLAKSLGTNALGDPLHPLQVSQGRFLFALLAIATYCAINGVHLKGTRYAPHALRSALGWGGVTLMFASTAFIPLGDATAISFLNPVIGMLLAIPFLGERVGPYRWGAAGLSVIGAMILLKPTSASFQPAALLALGAAFVLGCELVVIKKLTYTNSRVAILLINNFFGACISSAAAFFVWQIPTPAQWAALAGIGFLMIAAQTCFVNAMARAEASFVSPFFYATLIFAVLYDFGIFKVLPSATSGIGIAFILVGAIILAWREGKKSAQ
jgi:drug/metabolite transporter (DMT)-like permease